MVKNLRLLRQEKKISQQQLADMILVSQQSVNKYENHEVEPDVETLIRIADIFDVSVDYLIGRTDIRDMAGETNLSSLTSLETELIKNFNRLNDTQKKIIINLIKSYIT